MPCALEKRVLLNDPFTKTLYVCDNVRPYLATFEMRLEVRYLGRMMAETTPVLYSELVANLPTVLVQESDGESTPVKNSPPSISRYG